MRSNSLISVLRKRRKISRRSRRIRYEDALIAMQAYQNGELKIDDVIDNIFSPSRSKSKHCQVPGCNMAIRYEYVLTHKITGDQLIAGSTCVWVLLGLSEEEIKNFNKIEASIKDYHAMVLWKKDNMDVFNKLERLKAADVTWYKPFWEEVEYCKLHPEDEKFIRELDVDKVIKEDEERKARRYGRPLPKASEAVVGVNVPAIISSPNVSKRADNVKSVTGEDDAGYEKVIKALEDMASKKDKDRMIQSMMRYVNDGKLLSTKQVYHIKAKANMYFYEDKIKGKAEEGMYNNCNDVIVSKFEEAVKLNKVKVYSGDSDLSSSWRAVEIVKKYRKQFDKFVDGLEAGDVVKSYWRMFKIKNLILS